MKKSFFSKPLKTWGLSPFFFTLQPIIHLAAINASELSFVDVLRPSIVAILITIIITGVFFLFLRSVQKASLVAALFTLFFYSFGDLSDLLHEKISLGVFRIDILILAGMFGILLFWALYLHKKITNPTNLNFNFNLIGLFMLLVSLFQWGSMFFKESYSFFTGSKKQKIEVIETSEELPDIYYIILDGYGRKDILNEFYGFDNSSFIDGLEEIGFYIAQESNSNYIQTLLSVGSTLNMDYIPELSLNGEEIRSRQDLIEIVRHSQVRKILAQKGYQMVSFENGYKATVPDAELFYDDIDANFLHPITGFESIILEHTMIRILYYSKEIKDFFVEMPYRTHQKQIISTFTRLKTIPDLAGNYFVYAHIISPHPPFIFEENGDFISHREPFSLFDANYFIKTHSQKNYIVGYSKQVQYVNTLVLETIQEILLRSETPPIIIIQGDHGPGAFLHWGLLEKTIPEERFGILNAYYFPAQNYDLLYSSISPVNSFPVLLNTFFEGDYKLSTDRHLYSKWMEPLNFTEIVLQ